MTELESVSTEPTLIDDEAKFLDGGQISTDSVDPVNLQTWKHKHDIRAERKKETKHKPTCESRSPLTDTKLSVVMTQFHTAHTSLVNGVHTDLNERRHRGSFTLAESQQMAAENLIWRRHDDINH